MTVPLYSNDGLSFFGIGMGQKLMAVIVVYFPKPEPHPSALITYATTVAASAATISDMMIHRAIFVEGRANRARRNWRVMRIAFKFIIPMLIK